jgi:hypothetical protein
LPRKSDWRWFGRALDPPNFSVSSISELIAGRLLEEIRMIRSQSPRQVPGAFDVDVVPVAIKHFAASRHLTRIGATEVLPGVD